ncbi:hypothetical protein M426DRAFT_220600 [Hypoxylon sp. CI-4A]|nr:hypothetical protein M426DRAFT_220600 [Hypoxylon sp. CI-4A]
MKCDIEPNPALIGSGIRFPLYVLSIVISLARPFYPNSKGFYLVNAALAVSGIALLSVGLRLVSRDELDLFHGVCLSLLLAISRPTARGSYGKGSWLTDLRFTPDGMWSLPLGLGVIGLLSGLAPLSSYALFDAVYGHPDAFGPRRDCNSQVVISMLGARVPVASPAFPWLVSIVFAAVFLSAAAMWYRYLGLVETPETVLGRVLEKLHTRVFNLPSEIDDSRLLAWFNEIQQLNWANVIPYRNIASPLGRLYLVITLEHTIWINNIDPDQRHFLLDVSWLQFVVLVITLLTLVGLVDRSPAEDDVDDGSVNLCVHLIQMTNPEPSRTATLRNFHLFDSRIVSSFLDIRTPSAGDSNYLKQILSSQHQKKSPNPSSRLPWPLGRLCFSRKP